MSSVLFGIGHVSSPFSKYNFRLDRMEIHNRKLSLSSQTPEHELSFALPLWNHRIFQVGREPHMDH